MGPAVSRITLRPSNCEKPDSSPERREDFAGGDFLFAGDRFMGRRRGAQFAAGLAAKAS